MKRFVYMDTPKIISYLAQVHDGHIVKQLLETADQVSKSTSEPANSMTVNYDGALSAGIIKANFGVSGTTHTLETSLIETQSAKELVERAMHDNMYNNLLGQLNTDGMIPDVPQVGKYFLATDVVRIIDLNMIHEAIEAYTNFNIYNYESTRKKSLNREQRRSPDMKAQIENNKPDTEMPIQVKNTLNLMRACGAIPNFV